MKVLDNQIKLVEMTIGELIEQHSKCQAGFLALEIKQQKERLEVLYDSRRRRIRKAKNSLNKTRRR
jgi:hypothetical protein